MTEKQLAQLLQLSHDSPVNRLDTPVGLKERTGPLFAHDSPGGLTATGSFCFTRPDEENSDSPHGESGRCNSCPHGLQLHSENNCSPLQRHRVRACPRHLDLRCARLHAEHPNQRNSP